MELGEFISKLDYLWRKYEKHRNRFYPVAFGALSVLISDPEDREVALKVIERSMQEILQKEVQNETQKYS
ncbi:MAG: hypothetical protein JRJ29_00375 [Deltaproteobacteria bacterium]|nr:hypothetical protein [Deltaproteobacteria bacterium]MBW2081622.1 hypothetical protein [Deltaproteobacteria bacterium]